MFKKDQKLFGYVLSNEEWLEFNSWDLMELSEVEYRKWKNRYENLIHVLPNEESQLIFFNRGHQTFSYFSDKNKEDQTGKNIYISLSHILRQKVITERKSACFSIKNKIFRTSSRITKYQIIFKKIEVDKRFTINGKEYISDLIIEFDEPADLALKWKGKVLIEVVEKNETNGEKIEAYEKLGHGVIEIPYSKAFDIFSKKRRNEIMREDINQLLSKIRNFFNKEIWSDLIVDPTSLEYLRFRAESSLAQQNIKLKDDIVTLKNAIEEIRKSYNELLKYSHFQKSTLESIKDNLENKNSIIEQRDKIIRLLKQQIISYNEKSLFSKMLKGGKLKLPCNGEELL